MLKLIWNFWKCAGQMKPLPAQFLRTLKFISLASHGNWKTVNKWSHGNYLRCYFRNVVISSAVRKWNKDCTNILKIILVKDFVHLKMQTVWFPIWFSLWVGEGVGVTALYELYRYIKKLYTDSICSSKGTVSSHFLYPFGLFSIGHKRVFLHSSLELVMIRYQIFGRVFHK